MNPGAAGGVSNGFPAADGDSGPTIRLMDVMTIRDLHDRMTENLRFDVLGRLLLALREYDRLTDYLPALDWWRTPDNTFAIGWQHGPYADEVAHRLLAYGRNVDTGSVDYGLRGQVAMIEAGPDVAVVEICRLPVLLQALHPVGYAAIYDRVWRDLHGTVGS